MTITALEKAMKSLVKKAEAKGLRAEIEVFKSGNGGDFYMSDVSHVDLTLEKNDYQTDDWDYENFRYDANGYDRREWKDVKKEIINFINN